MGELAEHFLGPVVWREAKEEEIEEMQRTVDCTIYHLPNEEEKIFNNKGKYIVTKLSEHKIAEKLYEKAKTILGLSKWDFIYEVTDVSVTNDDIHGMTEKAMIKRAKAVQEKLFEIAKEMLR